MVSLTKIVEVTVSYTTYAVLVTSPEQLVGHEPPVFAPGYWPVPLYVKALQPDGDMPTEGLCAFGLSAFLLSVLVLFLDARNCLSAELSPVPEGARLLVFDEVLSLPMAVTKGGLRLSAPGLVFDPFVKL